MNNDEFSFSQVIVDLNEVEEHKNQCLKQRTKQLTGIINYSYRSSVLNKYCKSNSKKLNELLDSIPCINSAMSETEKCYNKLLDNIIGARYVSDNLRIPHICW